MVRTAKKDSSLPKTGKEPTAFLWIPSDCHQLRAVMVGKHNMSEETLFEMPRFREALSRMGIGLVWITPGIDQQWDVTKGTQEIFNRMMNDLGGSQRLILSWNIYL